MRMNLAGSKPAPGERPSTSIHHLRDQVWSRLKKEVVASRRVHGDGTGTVRRELAAGAAVSVNLTSPLSLPTAS